MKNKYILRQETSTMAGLYASIKVVQVISKERNNGDINNPDITKETSLSNTLPLPASVQQQNDQVVTSSG